MKNSVPFVDEEYLVREKQAAPPVRADTTVSTPKATSTVRRHNNGPCAVPPKQASARTSEARVYWHPTHNGLCLKVNISGCPDIRTLRQWRRLMHDCRRLHTQRFEFDLQETGEIGLTTLTLLLILKERQQVTPRDMVLNQCSPEMCQLLEWTGLIEEFTVRALRGSE